MKSSMLTIPLAVFTICSGILAEDKTDDENYEQDLLAGVAAFKAGDLGEAERKFTACWEKAQKFDAKDERRSEILNNLGGLYFQQGKYAEAEPYLEKSVALSEALGKAENDGFALMLSNLAVLYITQSKYDKAEAAMLRSIAIMEKARGKEDPSIAGMQLSLGVLYTRMGEYAKAEDPLKRAFGIRKTALGEDHPDTALVLSRIGNLQFRTNHFEEAKELYTRSLDTFGKHLGQEHPLYAETLNNLGSTELAMEEYGDAERHLAQSVAIRERILQPSDINLALGLGSLAVLYHRIGDLKKGEELFRRQKEILEAALGPDSVELAEALNNLAALVYDQGKHEEAAALHRRALAIRIKVLGTDHPDVARSMNNLAATLSGIGATEESRKLYRQAIEIDEKNGFKDTLEAAAHLINLANLESDAGTDMSLPDDLFQRAQRIIEKREATQFPIMALLKFGWGRHEVRKKQNEQALGHFLEACEVQNRVRDKVFSACSERQRLYWAEANYWYLKWVLYLLNEVREPSTKTVGRALDVFWATRGAVFQSMLDEWRAVRKGKQPEVDGIVDKIVSIRQKIAAAYLRGSGQTKEVQEWEGGLDELENTLAHNSRDFGFIQKRSGAKFSDVAAALQPGSMLVTFARFESFVGEKKDVDRRLMAFVLKPGPILQLFDLGRESEIDMAIRDYLALVAAPAAAPEPGSGGRPASNILEKGKALSKLVLGPLWKDIGSADRWTVSPDGLLAAVPLAVLPEPIGARLVLENHEVNYISSGNEIVAPEVGSKSNSKAVLFVDPDFDSISNVAGTQRHQSGSRVWTRLPGTREEGKVLGNLFAQSNLDVLLREGSNATKTALMDIQAPRFLHIATHGFYIADQSNSGHRGLADRGLAGVTTGLEATVGNASSTAWGKLTDPLVRSGLVLAGANLNERGRSLGIVTAKELTGLDLWGTELVVLSACESGLGERSSSEGVIGLRRSFLQSGARTVVSSLWKIPDRETAQLMKAFYRLKLTGARTSTALRQAMLEIRESVQKAQGTDNPYYWGAFVLYGDPN